MASVPKLDFPEMLGQMLYLDLFNEADVNLLSRYRAGGVMVRRRYAKSTRQVVRLISRHQEEAVRPLFVGANFEWGAGNDTPNGTVFPGLMAVGASGKPTAARDYARTTAREATAMGINHILSPVLDVVRATRTPDQVPRSMSDDPKRVSSLGREIIKSFHQFNLMATAKHFPGTGSLEVDIFTGPAVLKLDKAEIENVDLLPFIAAIAEGVDCIMVSHAHVPALLGPDGGPGSLSSVLIQDYLRNRLNFKGLVMTDNLSMPAISMSPIDACIASIRAGADLLLTKQEVLRPDHFADLLRIVERDKTLVKNVITSYKRIMEAKEKLGLFKPAAPINVDEAESFIGSDTNAKVAKRVSLGAITIFRDSGRLPVKLGKKDKIVVVTPRVPESLLVPMKDNWGHFYRTVKEYHPATTPAYVSYSPTSEESDKTIKAAAKADMVFVVLSHEVGLHVNGAQVELANNIHKVNPNVVAIVMGTPYPANNLSKDISTVILTYSNMPPSQVAAAEVILGKAAAAGKLPIRL